MIELPMLRLPILVSAGIVFVVSSLIHMASPWHNRVFPIGVLFFTASSEALPEDVADFSR